MPAPSPMRSVLLALALVLAGCSQTETTAEEIGCPGADYPDWQRSPYVIPFAVGTVVATGLTNCTGSFHSEGQPDAFAYDFDVPMRTVVLASRAGEVVAIDESRQDYPGVYETGNYVLVDHGDGTQGFYLHFTTDGVSVEVGDELEPGDVIGLSGASGLAGYPHLHLVVVDAEARAPYVSLPFTFRNTRPNPDGLEPYSAYEVEPY